MDINSTKKIIKAAVDADDAVIMEGPHGIGKSDIVLQFAEENGYHFQPLFLSHQEVGDLIGIPHLIEKNGVTITTWSIPSWLQRMKEAAEKGIPGILFLDELNRAPLDVRQSALQLVLERKIHEHDLPIVNGQRTMIVAAINPSSAYQVDELDAALLDRFLHISVDADVKTWLKWSKNKVNNIVRDFIIENPNRLHFTPADGGNGTSPRSWAKLGRYIDNEKDIDDNTMMQIIKGKLGDAIAAQFYMFYKAYSKSIKIDAIEDLVNSMSKKTNDINVIAQSVYELIQDSEAIKKYELAEQLMTKYTVPETRDILPFLAYLYALDVEICQGFLKKMKESEPARYRLLVDFDDKLNGKSLFLKFVNKIVEKII